MAIWKTSGSESGSKFCRMGCYTHTMINPRMLVSTMFWSTESAALTLSTWWSRVIAENKIQLANTEEKPSLFNRLKIICCPSNCPASEPYSHRFPSLTLCGYSLKQAFSFIHKNSCLVKTHLKVKPYFLTSDLILKVIGIWWGILEADIWQWSW